MAQASQLKGIGPNKAMIIVCVWEIYRKMKGVGLKEKGLVSNKLKETEYFDQSDTQIIEVGDMAEIMQTVVCS